MCVYVPHLGLAASDRSGPDGSGLLVPAQNFGHAAVGDPQLAGDDARTDTVMGHFHDFVADVVGERSPVYEDPTKLVHPTLSKRSGDCRAREGEGSSHITNERETFFFWSRNHPWLHVTVATPSELSEMEHRVLQINRIYLK